MTPMSPKSVFIETLKRPDYLLEVMPYEMVAGDSNGKLVYDIRVRSATGRRGIVRVAFESHGAKVVENVAREGRTIQVEANNVEWTD